MALQYKFVELSPVTDETIEACVNDWVGQGWQLEGIRFVPTEHSRRPHIAFVSFTCDAAIAAEGRGRAPRQPARPSIDPGLDDADEPAVITAKHGADVD